jgi:hypothetical protein
MRLLITKSISEDSMACLISHSTNKLPYLPFEAHVNLTELFVKNIVQILTTNF